MPQATSVFSPSARAAILVAFVFFGIYLGYEVWRWRTGNPAMLTPGQFRRRMLGGLMLEVDLLLWYLANPLLAGRPAAERLLYLLAATLFVLLPMLLAVQEALFVVRQYSQWRRELLRNLGNRAAGGDEAAATEPNARQ